MSDKCEHYYACKNNGKCYRCFDKELLSLPKEKNNKRINKVSSFKTSNASNSWEDLEDDVTTRLNQVPSAKESRRTRASGALWYEKGDVLDQLLHAECKERDGKEILNGADKSISFQKLWLTKAKKEAENVDKIMIVPFRFKNDDVIYSAMEFEDIATLVTMYKSIDRENQLLIEQNKILQEKIKKLEEENKN